MSSDDIETIEISGDMIRLGQFLKFANFAESGAHAGAMIGDGDVLVDGEVETRRGRQLAKGMVVEVRTASAVHTAKVG
ncbi:RNA-binding S4 domain-containing protein [Aeromicrobium wangtongii]|uniref:RNA-binding S4 domain-containing protein n=1 Tax=Aeromicrobium wangtongii TaxID=2969247 RepID=A0ABY5M756_9ACTN|nr:RNA-binding S4 domain-containing protein [Aeromicrobium wangtongii]UUP12612.1 RNA-binding S4 domain-containing protein [Aeromicrobium wangtongii]